MTEKELLKKLNSYKAIQADSTWKEKNREVLFNQIINSSSNVEAGFSFAKIVNNFKIYSDTFYNGIVKNMGQPIILTSMIVVMVLGGSVVSISASRDTTPGDSLYIAKKISEKTQLAFTFDEKKKAQLNVSFAENRAKEIAQVMIKERPEEEKQEIVNKLTDDFKQEISNVKTRIEKIAQNKKDEPKTELSPEETVVEEDSLFTANLGKGDTGLSLGEQSEETVVSDTEDEPTVVIEEEEGTTTVEIINVNTDPATTSEEIKTDGSSHDLLNEVKALIESDDYDATLEKLDKVSSSFDEESEPGEVKGEMEEAPVEETASTTEE